MSIDILSPAYRITVGIMYFADITATTGGVNTYATPKGVNSIKNIGVTKQKSEQKVFASGFTYKYSSRKTGSQIQVSALQLPKDIIRKYAGKTVSTNKGFSFEQITDDLPEFATGYTTEYSDGKKVFKWFPRCVLAEYDDTVETSTDTPTEPSVAYQIVALPYNGLIEVEYDQSQVVSGKTPLSEEQFFAAVISKTDDALVDSEATAGA